MHESTPFLVLAVVSGPELGTFRVEAGRVAAIGRSAACDICLVHPAVSRQHASVQFRSGTWFLHHLSPRSPTFVNGVHLEANGTVALAPGDLVRIGPWSLLVSSDEPPTATALSTLGGFEETPRSGRVESLRPAVTGVDYRLRLLAEFIGKLRHTATEPDMAAAALQSALAGGGYARGAVLRPGAGGQIEALASLRANPEDARDFRFSHALIQRAAAGQAVVLSSAADEMGSNSIAELSIHSALCAPVMLGDAVSAYLYLDARGRESAVLPDSSGFCEAVARALGLALAESKRAELERRRAELTAELGAAREVQQLIQPAAHGHVGLFEYALEMRPGQLVAGDLFDLIQLPRGGVALCIGDATGHGAGSAMQMAITQAYLHAELSRDGDPAAAVTAVNRYLAEHSGGGRFVSLWVGVFRPDGTVEVVDAGHGYCLLKRAGRAAEMGPGASGPPVGISLDRSYSASELRLGRGDRLVLFSDGLVDQQNPGGERFGQDRLIGALNASPGAAQDVSSIFAAITAFAEGRPLDDDATAASLCWC